MKSLISSPLIAGGQGDSALSVSIGAPSKKGSTAVTAPVSLTTQAYDAASCSSQELSGFNPRLLSADAEILPSRDKITARSRSMARNSGWAQGGFEKRTDAVVGGNIWLRCRPDYLAMGQTAEWAAKWSMQTESLFRLWGNSVRFLADVERHHHFGGLVRLAYQHYGIDGEAAAKLDFLERGGMFATCVGIVDPDRIDNPDGRNDDAFLRSGVVLDGHGAAIGYWVRNRHEGDLGVTGWDAHKFTYHPRETPTGRPMFVHVFNKSRAHQRRGVGRLASVMGRMKMLERYDQTELQAAITNAIFGLYAKTTRSSDEVRESLAPAADDEDPLDLLDAARAQFYDDADITFNGVRVAVMPDGDEIDTIEAGRTGSNFQAFQRAVLNSIAAALGISGEQLSNDWAGINYSNARTLLNEIWRGLLTDRHLFTQSFCTPIYAAWLEEAVARDLIEVPGGKAMFYVFRDALCQCQWIGPGKGWIDPKKEMEATEGRIRVGVSNLPDEAAEQGNDWEHNLWEEKRVLERRKEFGLPTQQPQEAQGNAGAGTDDDDDPDRRDREESSQSGRTE